MFYSFTVSEGFDLEINQASNGVKILILDMAVWVKRLKSEFPGVLKLSAKLEQLDLTYILPGLAEAPFPSLGDLETRAERSTALLQQWRNYPSVGLVIYTAQQGGFWTRAGTLPLQNHGAENWQPLLIPFLTTATEVFLMGEKTKIAVEIVDRGHGKLKAGDKLTIRGAFVCEVAVWEKEQEIIQQRQSSSISLNNGIATQILQYNIKRKYVYLSNTGANQIQFIFGTVEELQQGAAIADNKIIQSRGLLLTPFGTASFNNSQYIEPAPIAAVAIGGNSRIAILEGW